MTLEELQVIISAKTAPMQAELKNISKQLKGLETNANNAMKGVQNSINKATTGIASAGRKLKSALIALGIGKTIKDSFNMARTYEASLGQVNRLLGENTAAFQRWVEKNALTFGLAKSQAMQYASIYGNLLTGFMPNTESVTYYTQELLKASSIIATSTGRTITDVNERIRSGLLGNTEAIEDLGVNVNVALLETTDAFKQLSNGVSWNKLSFQTQQQIRLMGILEQTSKKFGDSIQNNTNYQLMILTAQLKDIALNIGNAFKPIVDVVLPILNSFAGVLVKVTNTLAVFMNALFGTNMKGVSTQTQSASEGLGGVANGYEEAGKEAEKAGKKAKGALASFDEVNQLNFSKDSGSGGSGGGAFDGIQLEDMSPIDQVADSLEDRLTKLIDAIKQEMDRLKEIFMDGFEIGLGDANFDGIKESINGIKESLIDIFSSQDVISSIRRFGDEIALTLGKIVGADLSIGITIAQNLLGGLDKYLKENGQYIKDRLVGIFNISTEITRIIGDFAVAFADIFSVFGGETAQQITANIIGMFSNAFLGVTELALRLGKDILNCITQPIIDNKEAFKVAVENLLKPIESITRSFKNLITDTYKSVLKAYEQYIEPAYQNIADGLSEIVKALLDAFNKYIAPTIDAMGKRWSEFYYDHLQPVIDKFIEIVGELALTFSEIYKNILAPFVAWMVDFFGPSISGTLNGISTIFEIVAQAITDTVGGLLDTFSGIIDFLNGVFKGDWELVWNGLKGIYEGVVNTFEGLLFKPLENMIAYIKDTFTTQWTNAWNTVSKVFEGVFNGLVRIVRGPMNLIIDAINTVIKGLNKLSITVPSWSPVAAGETWGVNIPTIPKLARGGIVDGATFMGNYIAGEAGKEMIVPLENTPFVDKLASALGNAVMMAMQFNNSSVSGEDNKEVVFEIDDREFARVIIPGLQKELRRTGVRLHD